MVYPIDHLFHSLVSTQSLAIKRSDEKAIVWRELNRSPNWFWTRDNLRGHWVQIQDRYLPLDFEGTLKGESEVEGMDGEVEP